MNCSSTTRVPADSWQTGRPATIAPNRNVPEHPEAAVNTTGVHLNICRMTVYGMSHHDEVRMTRAMEREFTRLVENLPELDWHTLSSIGRLQAADCPAGSSADEIGRHVANEIFRGLSRHKS